MKWNRIQIGTTEKLLSVGSTVQSGYTSLYTVDTSIQNTYKLTIKSVSSNDFNYAYMCFGSVETSGIYYFAQITNGTSNSRNSYYILHINILFLSKL